MLRADTALVRELPQRAEPCVRQSMRAQQRRVHDARDRRDTGASVRRPDGRVPPLLPLITLVLASGVGCGPPRYVQPDLREPHATVTLRVVHHALSGRDLSHQTLVDGHGLPLEGRDAVVRGAPFTRSVRVRPGTRRWRFQSEFSHVESRLETVFETEQYACGTQTTGYGSTSRASTRYCTRQVPRQRMRTLRVSDGRCDSDLLHSAWVGQQYVVQFDYHADQQCRSRCFEQTPTSGGRFALRPCALGPPPAEASEERVSATPASTRTAGSEVPAPARSASVGGRDLDAP